MKTLTSAAIAAATILSTQVGNLLAATATFDDLGLATESAENGFGLTPYTTGTAFGEIENWNRFGTGGITFENRTIPQFGSWSRWAASNQTDTITAGFSNDLSSWAGGGAEEVTGRIIAGSGYGIAFGQSNRIDLPVDSRAPSSVMITNTTYPALSMQDGDAFSKRFGGADGTDPDYFLLSILGESASGSVTGSVDFYLADYRSDNSIDDFIRSDWGVVDLTPLGTNVAALRFELSSTDIGAFGMNTPAYFALDNLTVVPEPSAMMLLAAGLATLVGFRRSRSRFLPMIAGTAALAGSAGLPAANAQGIAADDPRIVSWASGVSDVIRGPLNAADFSLGHASFGDPFSALGAADVWALDQENAPVISLGDGGRITVTFDPPIANGPGADFAVFENGFNDAFLELAFVEVSTDGSTFKRFPAAALNQPAEQIGPFDNVVPSGLRNLAGLHPAGIGTPFDLDDVQLDEVTHVRLIDVVGSVDPAFGSPDSEGNFINDPFPTPFASGGFDLDAVGVLHQRVNTPIPGTVVTYDIWIRSHFSEEARKLPELVAQKADPDSDGVSNFVEYAWWTDPNIPNDPPSLDITFLQDEKIVEVRPRLLPALRKDVDYSIESSDGLVYWESETGIQPIGADTESAEQQFFRLVVEPLGDDID